MKILKISVLLLTLILIFTSCSLGFLSYFNKKTMNGDRNVLGRTYPMTAGEQYSIALKDISIDDFGGLRLVIFDETLSDSLVITTDENIFLSFDVNVDEENKIITIKGDPDCKYVPTTFEIAVGGLVNNIDISGTFTVDMKFNEIKTPNVTLEGAVSGTVLLDNTESIKFTTSGAVSLTLDGIVNVFTAEISGTADINGYELETNTAHLNVSGASAIKLTVNQELYVEMTGASIVHYKGNAEIKKSDINGLGEIIKED